jgi:hypothetical protein
LPTEKGGSGLLKFFRLSLFYVTNKGVSNENLGKNLFIRPLSAFFKKLNKIFVVTIERKVSFF